MDKEALYWMLSTLPQVSAALVAFIGFLALQSLEEPRRRGAELEDKSRKHVENSYASESWKNFGIFFEIEVMSSKELAIKIDSLLDAHRLETPKRGSALEVLRGYRKEWRIVDQQINGTQRFLKGFVSIHLLVIGGTLSLIPYIPRLAPRLAGYPWIEEAVVATALLMVVTVGIMIFVALKPSAN
jgi:hypothetical protein